MSKGKWKHIHNAEREKNKINRLLEVWQCLPHLKCTIRFSSGKSNFYLSWMFANRCEKLFYSCHFLFASTLSHDIVFSLSTCEWRSYTNNPKKKNCMHSNRTSVSLWIFTKRFIFFFFSFRSIVILRVTQKYKSPFQYLILRLCYLSFLSLSFSRAYSALHFNVSFLLIFGCNFAWEHTKTQPAFHETGSCCLLLTW